MTLVRDPIARVGESGFFLQLNTSEDLSSYSTFYFRFWKPDGTSVDKSATAVTTAADGDFEYQVESGLLDQSGRWRVALVAITGSHEIVGDVEDLPIALASP